MWTRKAAHSPDTITLAKALIAVTEAHDAGYDSYQELVADVVKIRAWATKLATSLGVEVPPMLQIVDEDETDEDGNVLIEVTRG